MVKLGTGQSWRITTSPFKSFKSRSSSLTSKIVGKKNSPLSKIQHPYLPRQQVVENSNLQIPVAKLNSHPRPFPSHFFSPDEKVGPLWRSFLLSCFISLGPSNFVHHSLNPDLAVETWISFQCGSQSRSLSDWLN
jgi:hypothetical protein